MTLVTTEWPINRKYILVLQAVSRGPDTLVFTSLTVKLGDIRPNAWSSTSSPKTTCTPCWWVPYRTKSKSRVSWQLPPTIILFLIICSFILFNWNRYYYLIVVILSSWSYLLINLLFLLVPRIKKGSWSNGYHQYTWSGI